MNFYTIMKLLGGVGIFLFAIKMISDSLQMAAGERLRRIIGMFTKTPVIGVLLGAAVTMLIQSSSATTVMTVSFVEAGLMNLMQAIGVIMGANIGTTITGQILAFKVKDFAFLFIIVGVIMMFCFSGKKVKHIGEGLLGFGLLFVGMQTMESSMSFLRSRQDIFLAFSSNPFMGLVAGTILTLLVQSSSATVGLTIALGSQGLIPLEAAIPIILGDNIGTTITAVLAALGTGREAKQACAAHVLFNIIGVCIFLPLLPLYIDAIRSSSDAIGHQIANAHTMFNVCNTLLFLPFVKYFAALIHRIIPDAPRKKAKEAMYLDPLLIEHTPVVAVAAVRNECGHMGQMALNLLSLTEKFIFEKKTDIKDEIVDLENRLDNLDTSIRIYASEVMRKGLNDGDARYLQSCIMVANDIERIGDHGKKLTDFFEIQKKNGEEFSPAAIRDIRKLYISAVHSVELALKSLDPDALSEETRRELKILAQESRERELELRIGHVERLNRGTCASGLWLAYLDALGSVEQISYRARKLAGRFDPEKQMDAGRH
ncbi:MAG: Na/Pi cotransporter family protein [Desulfovibrionaceae bacterium]|nr:Na/Pi cotransporter family protein [Desulfovibrionaceae bacterium]